MKKVGIVEQAGCPGKPPWTLAPEEVRDLMQNFMQDKACVAEADAVRVIRWAEAQKAAAILLAWVLDNHMQVDVTDGEVTLTPRC
jgi:hypothetical protein